MSDIVMLKSWVTIQLPEVYNPMLDVPQWRRIKTIGELRHEKQVGKNFNF
jgi:ribosome biogenesis protein BMS1